MLSVEVFVFRAGHSPATPWAGECARDTLGGGLRGGRRLLPPAILPGHARCRGMGITGVRDWNCRGPRRHLGGTCEGKNKYLAGCIRLQIPV